jgi:hypothetical protein
MNYNFAQSQLNMFLHCTLCNQLIQQAVECWNKCQQDISNMKTLHEANRGQGHSQHNSLSFLAKNRFLPNIRRSLMILALHCTAQHCRAGIPDTDAKILASHTKFPRNTSRDCRDCTTIESTPVQAGTRCR